MDVGEGCVWLSQRLTAPRSQPYISENKAGPSSFVWSIDGRKGRGRRGGGRSPAGALLMVHDPVQSEPRASSQSRFSTMDSTQTVSNTFVLGFFFIMSVTLVCVCVCVKANSDRVR